jgi:hypothetical protein
LYGVDQNVLLVHKALIYRKTNGEDLEYSELRNFMGLILSHLDRINEAGGSVKTTEIVLIVDRVMRALRFFQDRPVCLPDGVADAICNE